MGLAVGAAQANLSAAEAASPLASHRWRDRVLVIAAPVPDDAALVEQQAAVKDARRDLRDRDLVVVSVVGDDAHDNRGATLDAAALRGDLGIPTDRFTAVLIGKDGGVKLRSDRPIAMATLFDTIDAMPMRRDEMRRGGTQGR